MNYTEIEIDGMKELLKENELEIGRLRKENKKLKEEIDTCRSVLSSYIIQYQRIKSQIYAINDVKNVSLKNVEKLEGENRILKDKIKKLELDTEHTIKFNNKIIGELKLENKKIKADYIKLSKIVETTGGYKASYVNELRDKIAKLEQELKIYKKQYKHTMGED